VRVRVPLILACVAAAVAAIVLSAAGGGEAGGRSYRIELRNAFDLTVGGDFKVRGAPAGRIGAIGIDRRKLVAVVTVELDDATHAGLNAGATCASQPQSLIGEYFVTCDPGKGAPLGDGATIPVARTRSTVPGDLVNDILRVPYRQRLTLVVNEFGLGLSGRGGDLGRAIREGVPALRETDRLLSVLSSQRHRLARLTEGADRVVGALAARRHDVARFVADAGHAAEVSASRRGDISLGIARLPGFLTELERTMGALDQFAQAQTPVAVHLGRTAAPLARFLGDLRPYARSSQPALSALARSAGAGRTAARAATPTSSQLLAATKRMPELTKNLRFVLEHLDDRSFGVEHDDRAAGQLAAPGPGGDRYTGLEGFLQYGFDQGSDITTFNKNGHFLVLDVLAAGRCANFADAKTVRDDPGLERDCSGNVYGPRSPGIHDPDPGLGSNGQAAALDYLLGP